MNYTELHDIKDTLENDVLATLLRAIDPNLPPSEYLKVVNMVSNTFYMSAAHNILKETLKDDIEKAEARLENAKQLNDYQGESVAELTHELLNVVLDSMNDIEKELEKND